MDEVTADRIDELMDWLTSRGWRRPPYELLTRLATMLDDEPVVYRDVRVSGRPYDYDATLLLFTATRLFVQRVDHPRGAARASVDIRVIRRSALQSLVSEATEDVALPLFERWCVGVGRVSRTLGERLHDLCAWLVDLDPYFERYYGRYFDPPQVSVVVTYGGLDEPIQLPLADDDEEAGRRFRAFLPSLVGNLS